MAKLVVNSKIAEPQDEFEQASDEALENEEFSGVESEEGDEDFSEEEEELEVEDF